MDEQQAREIAYMPALELRERYRRRELSPIEVTGVVLERIGRLNPSLNAFLTVTVERALDDARAAERAYLSNNEPGALAGIPISIKDLTPTKGIRTTLGSLLYKDWVPDFDAPFVERVAAAGAVMLGKTNTPEHGWKGDSGNRLIGPTHNPWKHGRTAGGSSGGAAAAVAAGLGPLAQGSDGAGSIRIPSGFCGIYGLKPSHGLVPYYPPSPIEHLSHMGPMTRTVRDAALLLNVTAGADERDRFSFSTGIDYVAACDGGIAGLRVAWSPTLGGAQVEPEVAEIAARAARTFERLGCHVEEVEPDLFDPWDIVDTFWAIRQAALYLDTYAQVRDLLDAHRLPIIERGFQIPATELARAGVRRNEYLDGMRHFMAPYDLLVTPQLPVAAFPAGDDHPGQINGVPCTYLGWTAFTYPFNLTGQPAATLPCGFTQEGLPVALQVVGRFHADDVVLRASAAFEEAQPWAQHRPPVD